MKKTKISKPEQLRINGETPDVLAKKVQISNTKIAVINRDMILKKKEDILEEIRLDKKKKKTLQRQEG